MEKIFKKDGTLSGYEFDNISIHCHINDPDAWFITIRSLSIFGERLAPKTTSENELIEIAIQKINKIQERINVVFKELDNVRGTLV